ncbi:hypothetical protein ACFSLT_07835 [Novosphingobium resinovorum]
MAQRDGDVAVDAEVEPLHRIAERGGADSAVEGGSVDDGDVVHGQFAAALEPAVLGAERLASGHVFLRFPPKASADKARGCT